MSKILYIVLFTFCLTRIDGQNVHTGESFMLENPVPSNETHVYNAGNFVSMQDGFNTNPVQENYFQAKTDPLMVFPPSEGIYGGPSYGDNGLVGTVTGSFSVSPTGAATYSIPLEFPNGIKGMNPSISLNYNSQSGDGIICDGWGLGGINAITRAPFTYYYNGYSQSIFFSNEDQLSMGGMYLIKIGDNEYRTENESFDKIIPVNNDINNGFKVYKRNGIIIEFGTTVGSRQYLQDCTIPVAWYIRKISDLFGNYILYNYNCDILNGYIYPENILYSGNSNAQLSPFYKIVFNYEDRQDAPKQYLYEINKTTNGLFTIITKRLTDVKCIYIPTNKEIFSYGLKYDMGGIFEKKFLASVTMHSGDNQHFNPSRFVWKHDDYSPVQNVSGILNEEYSDTTIVLSGNVNFDNKGDLFHITNNQNLLLNEFLLCIHLNNGSGNFNSEPDAEYTFPFSNISTFLIQDLNRDNVSDLFFVTSDANYYFGKVLYIYCNEQNQISIDDQSPNLFQIPKSTFQFPEFVLSDFSGDALVDCSMIYYSSYPNQKKCVFYLSTIENPFSNVISGGPAIDASEIYFAGDFDGDYKSELLFVNEDKSDVIQLAGNNSIILYNSIDMLKCSSAQKVVSGDFNLDGKMDILHFGYENNVSLWTMYYSYGAGFYVESIPSIETMIGGYRIFTSDLNNDSRTDIIKYSFQYNGGNTELIRSDFLAGPDGKSFNKHTYSTVFQNILSINGFRFLIDDFAFTGYLDFLILNNDVDDGSYKILTDQTNSNCNSIKEFINSMSETTKVEYYPFNLLDDYSETGSVTYPVNHFRQSLNVVDYYSLDNGSENLNFIDFQYKGAKVHLAGKGFLGFSEISSVNENNQIKTSSYYSFNNPYFNVVNTGAKQWLVSNGNLISEISTIHNFINLGNLRYMSLVAQNTTESYEIDGTQKFAFKTIYDYDEYGNVINKYEYTGNSLNNLLYLTTTYQHYTNIITPTYWCLGLPDIVQITTSAPDTPNITSLSNNEYNPFNGKLLKIYFEPNNVKGYKKEFFYDNIYGNTIEEKISATGLNSRSSFSQYSANGRFLIKIINAKGHEQHYQYYEEYGLLKTAQDANGLITTYYYDGFSRLLKTVFPDQTITENVLRWSNDHEDAPLGSVYYNWSQSSGTSEVLTFFDRLGRELRIVSIGFSGQKIYSDVVYYSEMGVTGLKKKISEPYFKGQTQYWTSFTYDNFRREKVILSPDYKVTTYNYSANSQTTVTQAGSQTQQAKQFFDAKGRVLYSIDNDNKKNEYQYYSNNLVKSVMVFGYPDTKIEKVYDIFGNLISDSDPDLGVKTYVYNAFGELISESDASGTNNYSYDILGRMINRDEPDGTTVWVYDTQENGLGKLHYSTYQMLDQDGGKSKSLIKDLFEYDELTRVIKQSQFIGEDEYQLLNAYDIKGRLKTLTYPSGYELHYKYNSYGYLDHIKDHSNKSLWQVDEMNARQQYLSLKYGENVTLTNIYDPLNGKLTALKAGSGSNYSNLQNLDYEWYAIGNLKKRTDYNKNLSERFEYDGLNRLDKVYLNNVLQMIMNYNPLGNILQKTDAGLYNYNGEGPHAVTNIDNNPNTISSEDQNIQYTSFDKVTAIVQGTKTLEINYGPGHNRISQIYDNGDGDILTKIYFNGIYEKKVLPDGSIKEIHYLNAGSGLFGIYTRNSDLNETFNYVLTDHIGSINVIINENGTLVEELSFDAWGRRRNTSNWTYNNLPSQFLLDRGFTSHEHLDNFGLINMNGRMYEPVVGRFLSPDPFTQFPQHTQGLNRYSYCLNNPLLYTDPSGYSIWSGIQMFINVMTIPARILADANEWLNDNINGDMNKNGYFNADYILYGSRPLDPNCIYSPNPDLYNIRSQGTVLLADGTYKDYVAEAYAAYTLKSMMEFDNTSEVFSYVNSIKNSLENSPSQKAEIICYQAAPNIASAVAEPAVGVSAYQYLQDAGRFPLDINVKSFLYPPARFGDSRTKGTRKHAGCDIYAPVGTEVYAVNDGEVTRDPYIFYRESYAVEINHNDYIVRYSEINAVGGLKKGSTIKKGQLIGCISDLSLPQSMLHFEMYSGHGTGPLTDKTNPPFLRRNDLVDPTNYLLQWLSR